MAETVIGQQGGKMILGRMEGENIFLRGSIKSQEMALPVFEALLNPDGYLLVGKPQIEVDSKLSPPRNEYIDLYFNCLDRIALG